MKTPINHELETSTVSLSVLLRRCQLVTGRRHYEIKAAAADSIKNNK
jgi:hypothetical protein